MTYLGLAAAFTTVSVLLAAATVVLCRPPGSWWAATGLTVLALVVLTVVFDSAMVAADLFRYDDASLTGVRLLRAPVEDLAWPLAVGLLLPSMAELTRRRVREVPR